MALITLFTSEILQTPLSIPNKTKFNQDLAKECYQLREMDHVGRKWSKNNYLGGYTSYSSYANMHEWSSTFEFLRKKIDTQVFKYLKGLEYDVSHHEICMTNFWVNIMPTKTVHTMHIHPKSIVSGTYYVQLPKDGVGIKFEDPRSVNFMHTLPRLTKARRDHQTFVTLKPKAGDLVLFESWMRHEVPPNPSKSDRISVSFNYGAF